MIRALGAAWLVATPLAVAQTTLDLHQGPRQFALGGAGVALPDRGRSANFNPALPAFSFPKGKFALGTHPTWRNTYHGQIRFKDWNAPLPVITDGELGPFAESFLGLPAAYLPGFGYVGLDKQKTFTTWAQNYHDDGYAFTVALAEDFLERGMASDSDFAWTGGITLKHYQSHNSWYGLDGTPQASNSEGFAFDLGWAWRFSHIPCIPNLKATLGLAFLNLGPLQYYDIEAYYNSGYSLPQEYRLGWSVEYRPFAPLLWQRRRWSPLRIIATQEFEKSFVVFDRRWNDYPFFTAFFHDFDKPLGRYFRETYVNAGAELTLAELFYLRGGRGKSTFNWTSPTWAFGYGLTTGPVFKHFYANYDYARILSLGAGREREPFNPYAFNISPREYGIQLGYLF